MNNFLNDLNFCQREAVLSTEKKVCVIAGPGCGKTRTLIAKVIHLLRNQKVKPQKVLILTFSKKSIKEIKERIIQQLGKIYSFWLNIHNFHSFCYKLLYENSQLFSIQKDFLIYDRNEQEALVKKIIHKETLTVYNFNDLMNNISLCKIKKNYLEDLKNNNYKDFLIYKNYQQLLKKESALDFNDLLLYVLNGLKNNKITREINFTDILIDEFQDVNEIQWEIVNLLIIKQEVRIFLVGDPNQSIYGFQGSSPHLISSLIKNNLWKKFFLNINYRSTQNIVELSNLFLKKNHDSLIYNQLKTSNLKGSPIEISENCSIQIIVSKILYLIENQNVKPNSIAIIYRNNYLSLFIEQQLIFNKIPYEVLGSFKLIEREEIKDLLAYLKTIRFQSNFSFLRILKGLAGVGNKLIKNIEEASNKHNLSIFVFLNKEFSDSLFVKNKNLKVNKLQKESLLNTIKSLNFLIEKTWKEQSLRNFVDDLLCEFSYFKKLTQKFNNHEQRKKNLQQFLNFLEAWEKKKVSDKQEFIHSKISDFLQYCAINFEDNNLQVEKNNLILSSVHQVKGLEFDCVFFLYLDHQILPHKMSTNLSEEKRIFYVGITRARRFLYLVSSTNNPSIFLKSLIDKK